ncbi:MAG: hypothetical protein ACJ790_17320 [Myxococcaceae bacterium]
MSAEATGHDGHGQPPAQIKVSPFDGGARAMMIAGVVGIIGLLATFAMMFVGDESGRRQAFASYLLGFAYWCGISVGALILLCAFHAAKAKWMTVIRRALETMAASVVIFVPLFIPILLGMGKIYGWWDFEAFVGKLEGHEAHAMHVKHAWFDHTFFLVRQVIYFATWIVVSMLMLNWSRQQDTGSHPLILKKMRVLGPASLPILAITFTFAGVDWLMSVEPLFFSTIYGVYYFAGSFLSCIAVLTFTTVNATGPNGYGLLVTKAHWHSLGKLLLAFVAFWAYIAFSQLLLIWISNLPEEVPYYILRWTPAWKGWSIALIASHFVIPFYLLLSRSWKQSRSFLIFITCYVLVINFVDLYWLIMPTFRPDGSMPHLSDITAVLGVGGISVAFAIWRARGAYSLPVADPFLAYSLRYVQPL